MERQNITLSLPKDVLLKVKMLAVRRGTSVSGLLTRTMERLVESDDAYTQARQNRLDRLSHAADLGTGGHLSIQRDELQKRA